MSDPRRLLDGGADPLGLSILRSGEYDAPSGRGRERTLIALGISGAALTSAGTAAATGVGWLARAAFAAKWVGVAAIAGGSVAVSAHFAPTFHGRDVVASTSSPAARRPSGVISRPAPKGAPGPASATDDGPDPIAAALAAAPPLTANARLPDALTTAATPAASRSSLESNDSRAAGSVRRVPKVADGTRVASDASDLSRRQVEAALERRSSANGLPGAIDAAHAPAENVTTQVNAAPSPVKISLADEVGFLDRVRSALRSGDAAGALRTLDAYQKAAPSGALGAQATGLRVEALLARGDRAAATSLGRSFVANYPRSPVADRIRALIGTVESVPSADGGN